MAESPVTTCVLCQIVAGRESAFKVLEDDKHLGFLDIFPNTEGFSVVIPKQHLVSDFVRAPKGAVADLLLAARRLARKIAQAYDDVDRCAVVMEGMMIDHLHAKLIPLHYTAGRRPDPEEGAARGNQYLRLIRAISPPRL